MRKILLGFLLLVATACTPVLAADQASKGQNATGIHTIVTVTLAGKTNYQWLAESLSASCATTPAAPILLTVKDGATVIWQQYITSGQHFPFNDLAAAPGDAMSASLADCGSSVAGTVNFIYKQR